MTDDTIGWLLEGDPAIRWQVERDLLGAPERRWQATRRDVSSEGWGAALLDAQDPEGTWDGGLYTPKWTSTTYTLLLLRRFGVAPSDDRARAGCVRLLDDASWVEGGVSYWTHRTEAERCVNAMVLSLVSYFDVDDERAGSLAELLARAQMGDGGWNCRDSRGATHSSFHTTISALEALTEWGRRSGEDVTPITRRGREFLLAHRLFRSHRTGEVIDSSWTIPHFPPRWHYDVLRGLDHLADVRADRDDRVTEAIATVRDRRGHHGRWPKGPQYTGRVFFTLESGRAGGRWNTLRALRVLRWWEGR